ncbi:carbamoyl-phosphate synthase large subunit [bacterium]|nr:carbamoyl-phosphate synthase large subunit [bacterium]QQR58455.1 MAG: carbamoyl-phosphate synthase large subunit [Candidatus Melainabacteria bacterium]
MPRRSDIKKILVIGAGPITIGQACEFDYSGTQACRALKEEGYEVILINSNPATIMTDPELAHRTYIEPVTASVTAKIIEQERPCAILPTMGGQTALNVAVELAESGVLAKFNVKLIGAQLEAIKLAEDRDSFKKCMLEIGLGVPNSGIARNIQDARRLAGEIGFPIIVRPAFTLGGIGGGIAYNQEELDETALHGINASPVGEVLLEESVLGWKELELEVMRDCNDNVVIICGIENFDPMGVHTGDSITVAPIQTLTDKEYQFLRDASKKIIRAIGVETGGSNIQFGIHPGTGRVVVIEMNPRVSRSSALASKATGYPIAKIAAKLAVGFTLDEISNDITRNTKASFEPVLDYVVTKIPRFNFDKFRGSDPVLTTQMRSVGEVMAIGRTFQESIQKALRGLELGLDGFGGVHKRSQADFWQWRSRLAKPSPHRITDIFGAFVAGISIDEIASLSAIDPWFVQNLYELYQMHESLQELKDNGKGLEDLTPEDLRFLKTRGFSDKQIAKAIGAKEEEVLKMREEHNIKPVYKIVDTCSAEFVSYTPYLYSTYESETEVPITGSGKPKVMILGGGPNRIGQGIEFDYCCVHASLSLRELGFEPIMVNSNPETVSTDYDVSDRLYFEPLTLEDVMNIADVEKPVGVIVQLGGQTPLKLAKGLEARGLKILGTSCESIDRAEDRAKFGEMINKLKLKQPAGAIAQSHSEAKEAALKVGYPVLVRPSYVLGGQAMEIIYNELDLDNWLARGFATGTGQSILLDEFLEDAVEIDVDAISDGRATIIAGIMEHVEQAGIHSGDSTCVLPTQTIPLKIIEQIRDSTMKLAAELEVKGLINIQFALKDGELYVLEVNPRASRTIPFVSKATGVPWAKLAAGVMAGKNLSQLGISPRHIPPYVAVKSVVIPFDRFPGAEISLGPEMRSTGEVMGIATRFDLAFAKAQLACGQALPVDGTAFISVTDKHKEEIVSIAQTLYTLGFKLIATRGTAQVITSAGIPVQFTNKVSEGRPNLVDQIKNGNVQLVINIPSGRSARGDDQIIRRSAINYKIPVVTTLSGARAVCSAIGVMQAGELPVKSLQEYHESINRSESKSRLTSAPYSQSV